MQSVNTRNYLGLHTSIESGGGTSDSSEILCTILLSRRDLSEATAWQIQIQSPLVTTLLHLEVAYYEACAWTGKFS